MIKYLLFSLNITTCLAGCCKGGACSAKKPVNLPKHKSTSQEKVVKKKFVDKTDKKVLEQLRGNLNAFSGRNTIDNNTLQMFADFEAKTQIRRKTDKNSTLTNNTNKEIDKTKLPNASTNETSNNNGNNNEQINQPKYSNKDCIIDYGGTPPLVGLNNIGATCFMNSVLQCLSQTKALAEYFLNPENKERIINNNIAKENKNNLQLVPIYLDLIKQLWGANGQKSFSPINFMKTIEKMNPLFKKGQAGDSKDFIIYILEQLHKELKTTYLQNNNQNEPLNQYDKNNALTHFYSDFMNDSSIISDLFFGINETTNECLNCKNYYNSKGCYNPICYNYGIFNCLIFPLEEVKNFKNNNMQNMQNMQMNNFNNPMYCNNMNNFNNPMYCNNMNNFNNPMYCNNMNNFNNPMYFNNMNNFNNPMYFNNMNNFNNPMYFNNAVTLYDCFEYNQKTDVFTGENRNYCNICKQLSDSNYCSKIFLSPDVLILILNRGKNNMYNIKLNFLETIDLNQFVQRKDKSKMYRLYGVITHIGESGPNAHFVASCRSPVDNKWYRYNDSFVNPINDLQKEVIDFGTPYILFYERV